MKTISKKICVALLTAVFAVCALACLWMAAFASAEENGAWTDAWAYQYGQPAGTLLEPDGNGYISTGELTAPPTIFQFEGLNGDRNPVPTALNGLKMVFTIELTEETPMYNLDGTFKSDAPAGVFNGFFLLVPKPMFYGAGANDFAFGTCIWADNFSEPDTLRFANAIISNGNPTWTGGTVASAPLYVKGQDNVLEVRYSGGTYIMYLNDVQVGEMSAENAMKFTDGKGYMIVQLNDSFGKAKLTIKELSAPETIGGRLLEKGSEEIVLAEEGVGGYRQMSAESPAVMYGNDAFARARFQEQGGDGFALTRVEQSLLGGSEFRFLYEAGASDTKEQFFADWQDASGSTLRLLLERGADSKTVARVLYKDAQVGTDQDITFYTDGATENNIRQVRTVRGYVFEVNGAALTADIHAAAEEMLAQSTGRQVTFSFGKLAAEEPVAAGATVTVSGAREVLIEEESPAEIVVRENAEYLADIDGNRYLYSLEDQAFSARYTEYKLLANSFAATFQVERFGENTEKFDLIISSSEDQWYTEATGIVLRFLPAETGAVMNVIVSKNGQETVIAENIAYNEFSWSGENNYIGIAYSNDDASWVYALSTASTYIPVAFTAEANAQLTQALAAFENANGYFAVENGVQADTAFQLVRIDYCVRRGVAPPNWSTEFNMPPVWGYYANEGEANLSSNGISTWYTNMPQAKVGVRNFRIDFDVYLQAAGSDGGLYMYLSSATTWYALAPSSLGIVFNYIDEDTAAVQFSYGVTENGVYTQGSGGSAQVDFSWKGSNTWEIKQDAGGSWQYYVNGTAVTFESEEEDAASVNEKMNETGFMQNFAGNAGQATLQIMNLRTDITLIVRELSYLQPNSRPSVEKYLSDDYNGTTVYVGEELRIDLSQYFSDRDEGDTLLFETSVGTIEGNELVYSPQEAQDEVVIRVTATDKEGMTAVQTFTVKAAVKEEGGGCGGCSGTAAGTTALPAAAALAIAVAALLKKKSAG